MTGFSFLVNYPFKMLMYSCFVDLLCLALLLSVFLPGVSCSLQAGSWVGESEYEAGDGPLRARANRGSLVSDRPTCGGSNSYRHIFLSREEE